MIIKKDDNEKDNVKRNVRSKRSKDNDNQSERSKRDKE